MPKHDYIRARPRRCHSALEPSW